MSQNRSDAAGNAANTHETTTTPEKGRQTNVTATSSETRETFAEGRLASVAQDPTKPFEPVPAGQTGPAIPWQKGVAPDGSVTDPARIAESKLEREAYLREDRIPDEQPVGGGLTAGEVRAQQQISAEPDSRRVEENKDESGEFSGRVSHVTVVEEVPAPAPPAPPAEK